MNFFFPAKIVSGDDRMAYLLYACIYFVKFAVS